MALFVALASLLVLSSLLCSDNTGRIHGSIEELAAESSASRHSSPTEKWPLQGTSTGLGLLFLV